jgi:hypothetical protein
MAAGEQHIQGFEVPVRRALTEPKGVNSSAYRPGRYSTQEKRISKFADWYMGMREQRLEQSAA